ncbi:hypothetical protein H6B26_29125, partial [Bacillus cereus]|nr:hypothetical protein [Bacillus cereus]
MVPASPSAASLVPRSAVSSAAAVGAQPPKAPAERAVKAAQIKESFTERT